MYRGSSFPDGTHNCILKTLVLHLSGGVFFFFELLGDLSIIGCQNSETLTRRPCVLKNHFYDVCVLKHRRGFSNQILVKQANQIPASLSVALRRWKCTEATRARFPLESDSFHYTCFTLYLNSQLECSSKQHK